MRALPLLLLALAAAMPAAADTRPAVAYAQVCAKSEGLYAGRVKFVSERLGPGPTYPDWAPIALGQTVCRTFEAGQPVRIEAEFWLRMVWQPICPNQRVTARDGTTLRLLNTVFDPGCTLTQ